VSLNMGVEGMMVTARSARLGRHHDYRKHGRAASRNGGRDGALTAVFGSGPQLQGQSGAAVSPWTIFARVSDSYIASLCRMRWSPVPSAFAGLSGGSRCSPLHPLVVAILVVGTALSGIFLYPYRTKRASWCARVAIAFSAYAIGYPVIRIRYPGDALRGAGAGVRRRLCIAGLQQRRSGDRGRARRQRLDRGCARVFANLAARPVYSARIDLAAPPWPSSSPKRWAIGLPPELMSRCIYRDIVVRLASFSPKRDADAAQLPGSLGKPFNP